MPNRRRRRPAQDEGRKDRQDFRQRAEQSRIQRHRIEDHRERRERRRETQRARRQQVDSVRSPKEDLRTDRWDSRLLPVEDSFLARPVGSPQELPVVIGESWYLSANQSLSAGVETTILFDVSLYTTERNGYPAIYNSSTGDWRIPAGLGGIWLWSLVTEWSTQPTTIRVEVNDVTKCEHIQTSGASVINGTIILVESDILEFKGLISGGGNVNGGEAITFASLVFLGK